MLRIKVVRCGGVLELVTFSCMLGMVGVGQGGVSGLLLLKKIEKSVCIQVHSRTFLANTSDFVGGNSVNDSIL